MIPHGLVRGHSDIQPSSRGPLQGGLSGIAMKEPRLKMSPCLQLLLPVVHHRAWTDNQEGTFLLVRLCLIEKK